MIGCSQSCARHQLFPQHDNEFLHVHELRFEYPFLVLLLLISLQVDFDNLNVDAVKFYTFIPFLTSFRPNGSCSHFYRFVEPEIFPKAFYFVSHFIRSTLCHHSVALINVKCLKSLSLLFLFITNVFYVQGKKRGKLFEYFFIHIYLYVHNRKGEGVENEKPRPSTKRQGISNAISA